MDQYLDYAKYMQMMDPNNQPGMYGGGGAELAQLQESNNGISNMINAISGQRADQAAQFRSDQSAERWTGSVAGKNYDLQPLQNQQGDFTNSDVALVNNMQKMQEFQAKAADLDRKAEANNQVKLAIAAMNNKTKETTAGMRDKTKNRELDLKNQDAIRKDTTAKLLKGMGLATTFEEKRSKAYDNSLKVATKYMVDDGMGGSKPASISLGDYMSNPDLIPDEQVEEQLLTKASFAKTAYLNHAFEPQVKNNPIYSTLIQEWAPDFKSNAWLETPYEAKYNIIMQKLQSPEVVAALMRRGMRPQDINPDYLILNSVPENGRLGGELFTQFLKFNKKQQDMMQGLNNTMINPAAGVGGGMNPMMTPRAGNPQGLPPANPSNVDLYSQFKQ